MDIHHLKIFVAVYKEKSFSKAAESVNLSQPTISEHIKNLEEELRCTLFDRMGRHIIPTPEADRLYEGAVRILDEIERLREEVILDKYSIKGELRIGASTIPGSYILPTRAAEFKKRHPEVSFEIIIRDTAEVTTMVKNHELIMGVVGAKLAPETLEYQEIAKDDIILVCKSGFIEEELIGPSELRKIPFILREKGSGTRETFERYLQGVGIDPGDLNVVAVLGSTDSVKEAVKSALGASFVSRIAVEEELKRGLLKELQIEGLEIKRNFYVVTHKKRTLPKAYGEFIRFLKETYNLR
jgi:DNA-binding transcriptional LysR family regulator